MSDQPHTQAPGGREKQKAWCISTVHRCVQLLLCRTCVQTIVTGGRVIHIYVIDSVTYILAQYSITQQKSETTTLQLVALSSC